MEYSKYYDYCVINDRLDDAVKEIEGILELSDWGIVAECL